MPNFTLNGRRVKKFFFRDAKQSQFVYIIIFVDGMIGFIHEAISRLHGEIIHEVFFFFRADVNIHFPVFFPIKKVPISSVRKIVFKTRNP